MNDYVALVLGVLDIYLNKIGVKLQQQFFNSTVEVGQLYSVYKLFQFNKDKWLEIYQQLETYLNEYEKIPIGQIAIDNYQLFLNRLVVSKQKFKRMYTSIDKVC